SGGPLFFQKGQVIGINTAKANKAEGLGFAIPVNTAKPIIEQIIKTGNFDKVTLGVKGMDVAKFEMSTGTNLEAENGVYVAEIIEGSPAKVSGIQPGDVIVKIGDTEIAGFTDLNKSLYTYSKGDKVNFLINRGGKEINIDVNFK
ncbi:MAG: PDZ domain-containing protein, partial [Clostridium sp.]